VGEDRGENPDNTLIVSRQMPQALAAKVATALLAVGKDPSPEAQVLKKIMKIQGFVETTTKDFDHTLALLKKAGVTKSFDFAY